MKSLTNNVCLPICLLMCSVAWLGVRPTDAVGQERAATPNPQQEVHNAPENVTGKLEGNEAELLNSWRFLSGLAVRFLSGNEAELLSGNAPELLSGNSTELLSGNAPELLSRNESSLLSENDPNLLSGNKVVLFSHNTLQIHLSDCGNNNATSQGAPTGPVSDFQTRWESQRELVKRQEARMLEQMKGAESRAKDAIEQERTKAKSLATELSLLREKVQEMAVQNSELQARITELETTKP